MRVLEERRARGGGADELRFLVVTPGPEGWGNRVLVIMAAVLTAMQTQRMIVLEWVGVCVCVCVCVCSCVCVCRCK